jgi:hemerythrin superfamily protein
MTESISEQSVAALGGQASVLVRQRRDHERLSQMLEELERTPEGDQQDELLNRICRLVFTHAFAEEAVLWPALRRAVPDGETLTLQVEREHQEINEITAALERSRRGDPDRAELVERAVALLDHDVRDEEDDLLPRLREALTDRELQRIGLAWELVRRTAPTRAHPVVARRPPGNVAAALPLTVIDRTRDGLDRLARLAPEPAAAAARATTRALATVAGAVEHVPPLPHGEDPSTHSCRTEREG